MLVTSAIDRRRCFIITPITLISAILFYVVALLESLQAMVRLGVNLPCSSLHRYRASESHIRRPLFANCFVASPLLWQAADTKRAAQKSSDRL